MNDRDAFLAAILAAPDDDTPRLAFADWLDGHGEAERAEFIRVQCELATFELLNGLPKDHSDGKRWTALNRRERELQDIDLFLQWCPPIVRHTATFIYRRGFAEAIRCAWQTCRDHLDEILRLHPLRRVRLTTAPDPLDGFHESCVMSSTGGRRWEHARWPGVQFEMPETWFRARPADAVVGRGESRTRAAGVAADKCSLLVVDDEPYILQTLTALLADEFEVLTADSADAAQEVLSRRPVDIVLTDQRMPNCSGVQLLEWVRQNRPATVRLLMTGHGELDDAVDAINRVHVYYYLLKPWRTEDLLQVLRNAADKVRLERKCDDMLEQLRKLNQELEQRIAERTRDLRDANTMLEQRTRELERLTRSDPLTGLFNRRAVEALAIAEIRRHNRYGNPLAIGIIDVDFFKRINTEFDLPGGDEALKALSRILTTSLRDVDSVGRIGGEEFLIIARETAVDGATALAERIRSTVATTPIEYRRHQISITVSLGFAVADYGVQTDFAAMYQLAASALSAAKRDGRNRFVIRRVGAVEN